MRRFALPRLLLVWFGFLVPLVGAPAWAQVSVTTSHNDIRRTGANLSEVILTTSNVNGVQFGKLFERAVDDQIYGQPLVVSGVNIPGMGVRNIVYVATVNNTIYAFDADNPSAASPVWSVNYGDPPGVTPLHRTDVGQACGTYTDFSGNIGIIGTPVIDPVANTIYFVVRTKENGAFVERLQALDIRTGQARPGSPVRIEATIQGTGAGSDQQQRLPFNPRTQNQRAALLLVNNTVFIAWASHCDTAPYHGWVMGYDATSLEQRMVYNTTPNGSMGGIWQSGEGLSADASGNLYAITGNGDVTGHVGGVDIGIGFVKIGQNGTLLDWFVPHNWSALNDLDADLMQGPLLLPDTNLLVSGGKHGILYLVDTLNMGRLRTGNDGQIVQSFQASTSGRMNGTPVYWASPNHGPVIYYWAGGDPLKMFRFVNGRFETTPVAQGAALAPQSMPGGVLSLSANQSVPGSGILWAALSASGNPNNETRPGILRAYDAMDVTRELWNSEQNSARDRLGNFSKFSAPTIANGKVYVATFSDRLVVYGLLGAGPGNTAPSVNGGPDQMVVLPTGGTLTAVATDDGNPNPPGALFISWTKITGPGPVTFGSPTSLATSVSFTTAGEYLLRVTVSDGAAASTDDVRVSVFPALGSGIGLLARYYNDPVAGTHFTTPALTRTDATVDFEWTGSPGGAVQADNFSVRWTGQLQAPDTGDFVLSTLSNDGVRLWINNELLIDNWTDHDTVMNTAAPVSLTRGVTYQVRLEFYAASGQAAAHLLWAYPGTPQQPVPAGALYPEIVANQPPLVDAGPNQTLAAPGVASLTGSATDDGLPNPPGALTYTWSKISGREESQNPVVFGDPHAMATTVTFPAEDVYVLRLTVSDGALTVSDDVTITVGTPTSGTGTGLTGRYYTGLDFDSLVLTRTDPIINFDWGVGPPANGFVDDNFSVRWTGKLRAIQSGPHTFSTTADDGVRLWVGGQLLIDNWVNQAATTVTSAPIDLVAGVDFDVRLEFFDHSEDALIRLEWSYTGQARTLIPQAQLYPDVGAANQPPTVSAGADQSVPFPGGALLSGTVTDDGLPNPPSAVSVSWTQVSGPAPALFSTPGSASTEVTLSAAGAYVFRLTASDGAVSASDDVVVIAASNQPPTVNAGVDATITLPANANLTGNAADDGLPAPPALIYSWQKVGGPGAVTFGNASAASTSAAFSVSGTYVLRLTVSDGALGASDDVTITVQPQSTPGTGIGLTGTYYNNPSGPGFTTLVLTRIDANVDFDWVRGRPAPVVQEDYFSVRWTGDVLAPVSGAYTFVTMSDDGVRLWINNQLVIDNWGNHPLAVNESAPVSLVAGVRYSVRLEYWDGVKNAVIRLHWRHPAQTTTVAIPQIQLFPTSGPANVAPVVNAGADQSVTQPAGASLDGTVTDDGQPTPPGAVTTTWTRVSGPGTVTFGNASAVDTTASFSAAGTYVLRLTANDGALSTADDVTVTVSAGNVAPVVSAGPDRSVTLPASAPLDGTVTDDGLPTPPGAVTTTWSMVSGSGTVTFGNASAVDTTASFSAAGTYVLRLTANDGALSAADDVTVTVSAGNVAPLVNAGPDRSVTLPASASLDGTVTDDGQPTPPGAVTTTWTRVSGPGTVTFGNASAVDTTASFSAAGTYVLRLTANDGALSTGDDVSVLVGAPSSENGLTGRYYSGLTLGTLRLTRVDAVVDFAWPGSPGASVPGNSWSARWTGQILAPVTGDYRFRTTSNDGVRLWVNGVQVINNWTDHAATMDTSVTIPMVAGVRYDIRLEFYDRSGDAVIRLEWAYPGQAFQVVPTSQLYR